MDVIWMVYGPAVKGVVSPPPWGSSTLAKDKEVVVEWSCVFLLLGP
jgi:hypothetical protein